MEDTSAQINRNMAACIGSTIRRANRMVSQYYDEALRPSGLRITQFSLLARVRSLGSGTINELAAAALMDRTTLGRNLKVLEKKGLVRIEPGPDQRMRKVGLTQEGGQALMRSLPYWKQAQRHMSETLGAVRVERLLSDLDHAIAAARGG